MSYYGTITIQGTECIGTSLSSINYNAANFDNLIHTLSGDFNSIIPTNASNLVVDWENGSGNQNHFYLMMDNTVRSNGYNGYGQLANGSIGYFKTEPEICSINGWNPQYGDTIKSIYCTTRSTYILSVSGKVWVSGYVYYGTGGGAAGGADNTDLNVFCNIPTITNVKKLSLSRSVVESDRSDFSVYALTNDGNIYSWGCNQVGQLGQGTVSIGTYIPTLMDNTNGLQGYYTEVVSGGFGGWGTMFAIAVKAGMTYIVSCGFGGLGALGLRDTTNYSIPQIITNISFATGNSNSIIGIRQTGDNGGSRSSTYFLTLGGQVLSCGDNTWGQLGQGNNTQYNTPALILGLGDIKDLQCSGWQDFVYILTNSGAIASWGYNGSGQLGLGHTTTETSPQLVSAMTNVKSISIANSSTVITRDINNDGNLSVWTCGHNGYGQIGIGNTVDQYSFTQVPLAIGNGVKVVKARYGLSDSEYVSTLQILLSNGRVLACGYNGYYTDGVLPNQADALVISLPNIVRFT